MNYSKASTYLHNKLCSITKCKSWFFTSQHEKSFFLTKQIDNKTVVTGMPCSEYTQYIYDTSLRFKACRLVQTTAIFFVLVSAFKSCLSAQFLLFSKGPNDSLNGSGTAGVNYILIVVRFLFGYSTTYLVRESHRYVCSI